MSGPTSNRIARWASRLPTITATAFRRLSLISLAMVSLASVSGAAVRLTGSGLGCTDWPECTHGHLTPSLQFHALIEGGNRGVTVLITVVVAVTLLAALRRRPFRADLAWLSGGLVGGVVLEAIMGGIVVYTKLNPYLVIVHFLASMPLVVDAVILVHRSSRDYAPGSGRLLVPRPVLASGRGLLVLLTLVLAAGAATSGAGPHAGSAQGQVAAKRLPVPLRDMAELHSSLAVLLIGVVLTLAVTLHALDVPERVRRAARVLVAILVAQAAVGYTQYFTHLPAAVVEVHVLGATVLVIGVTQFFLSLTFHPAEQVTPPVLTNGSLPTRTRELSTTRAHTSAEGAPVTG